MILCHQNLAPAKNDFNDFNDKIGLFKTFTANQINTSDSDSTTKYNTMVRVLKYNRDFHNFDNENNSKIHDMMLQVLTSLQGNYEVGVYSLLQQNSGMETSLRLKTIQMLANNNLSLFDLISIATVGTEAGLHISTESPVQTSHDIQNLKDHVSKILQALPIENNIKPFQS